MDGGERCNGLKQGKYEKTGAIYIGILGALPIDAFDTNVYSPFFDSGKESREKA